MLLDSAKLQEEFAKRAARHAKRDPGRAAHDAARNATEYSELLRLAAEGAESPGGPDPEELLREAGPGGRCSTSATRCTPRTTSTSRCRCSRRVPYGMEHEVAHGVHVTLADAGHILGSAIVRMRLARPGGGRDTIVVFSGDLGRPGTPIIRDPTPITEGDFVLCESTYGGREHEPAGEAINTLADVVNDAVRRKGVLLIPSFAIGRTQEIVWQLSRLLDAGRIPDLPVYLDSPMAKSASEVYRNHPEAYDEETDALLKAHEAPLDFPGQHIVQNVQESERIAQAPPPLIIIASNGMLTGRTVRGPRGAAARRPDGDRAVRRLPGRGHAGRPPRPRHPDARGSRATTCRSRRRSGRSTGSPPTPTSRSCSRGSAGSSAGGGPATRACRATCTSSTATRRPRRRCSRRSTRSASTPRSPPGTRRCRWTEPRRRSGPAGDARHASFLVDSIALMRATHRGDTEPRRLRRIRSLSMRATHHSRPVDTKRCARRMAARPLGTGVSGRGP